MNTHEGILEFWKESGASSVMVARAAEWNVTVFRKEGKLPIKEVRIVFTANTKPAYRKNSVMLELLSGMSQYSGKELKR